MDHLPGSGLAVSRSGSRRSTSSSSLRRSSAQTTSWLSNARCMTPPIARLQAQPPEQRDEAWVSSDVLPSGVYQQQTGYEEALVHQMLQPQETAVQLAQRQRQGGEIKADIARRRGATTEAGLFFLERPSGCIDVTNASVQGRQAQCLRHLGGGRNPVPGGQRLVVAAKIRA